MNEQIEQTEQKRTKKMTKQITNKKIVEIYKKKGCNVSATCKALGIGRTTYYSYLKSRAMLKEALASAYEEIIDEVEDKLLEKIRDGDTTALIFYLKTKGKKRGYVEKIETEEVRDKVVTHLYIPDNGRRRKKD